MVEGNLIRLPFHNLLKKEENEFLKMAGKLSENTKSCN